MRFAAAALAPLLLAWSGVARAAGDCPDGDWFCDTAPTPAAPGPAAPRDAPPSEAAPPPPAAPPSDDELERREERERLIRLDVEHVEPARPRRHRRFREWGVGVHLGLGLMGSDDGYANPEADMNGFGASLRFRPIPHIAIEGSFELFWGTDYNGFSRFEDALLANALFFANPRSAVQLYLLAGIGGGNAWLDAGRVDPPLADERYSYLGMQLGFGVEARVTRRLAFGGDLLGFVRGRTDHGARDNPEFVDPVSHRTSNTSGGGILRLGSTLYW